MKEYKTYYYYYFWYIIFIVVKVIKNFNKITITLSIVKTITKLKMNIIVLIILLTKLFINNIFIKILEL